MASRTEAEVEASIARSGYGTVDDYLGSSNQGLAPRGPALRHDQRDDGSYTLVEDEPDDMEGIVGDETNEDEGDTTEEDEDENMEEDGGEDTEDE